MRPLSFVPVRRRRLSEVIRHRQHKNQKELASPVCKFSAAAAEEAAAAAATQLTIMARVMKRLVVSLTVVCCDSLTCDLELLARLRTAVRLYS